MCSTSPPVAVLHLPLSCSASRRRRRPFLARRAVHRRWSCLSPARPSLLAAASSSVSAVRRRTLALPLARCPTCKEKVRMYVSTTEKHDGWVFYKCEKNGVSCDFWQWELEYVEYLVDKNYLTSDAAVDVIGAAEERREELLKAQELVYMNGSVSLGKKVMKNDNANLMTRQQAAALMMLGRELVMLMKMLLGVVLVIGLVALVVMMLKK